MTFIKKMRRNFGLFLACQVILPGRAPAQQTRLETRFETAFTQFLRRTLTMENVRWELFPIRFKADNIRLWESPDRVMAEGPSAEMTVAAKSALQARVCVRMLRFSNVTGYLRYAHDGSTNVGDLLSDRREYAREHRRAPHRQKVVYDTLVIESSKLHVIDVDNNLEPLGAPLTVDGRGRFNGTGPHTRFSFYMDGFSSGPAATRVRVEGVLGHRPIVHANVSRLPARTLTPYLPGTRWLTGSIDAVFDFSKAGAYRFWRWRFASEPLQFQGMPLPLLRVDGMLHAFAPSEIRARLTGRASAVQIVARIKSFRKKRAAVAVRAKRIDIDECVQWCRAAYFLSNGADSPDALRERLRRRMTWRVMGQADVRADISSVLGPRLLRDGQGRVTLAIRNGYLIEMPGLVKAFARLNLGSLLRPSALKQAGIPFHVVNATVDIKDGIAQSRGIISLESPTLRLGLTGTADFAKQTIHANLLVQGGAIPVWLSINGPFSNPDVTLLPTEQPR